MVYNTAFMYVCLSYVIGGLVFSMLDMASTFFYKLYLAVSFCLILFILYIRVTAQL